MRNEGTSQTKIKERDRSEENKRGGTTTVKKDTVQYKEEEVQKPIE